VESAAVADYRKSGPVPIRERQAYSDEFTWWPVLTAAPSASDRPLARPLGVIAGQERGARDIGLLNGK
jgi:hypothetical protein